MNHHVCKVLNKDNVDNKDKDNDKIVASSMFYQIPKQPNAPKEDSSKILILYEDLKLVTADFKPNTKNNHYRNQ